MSQRGGAQNAGRPSRRAVRGNPRRTFGSGGALGRRGRALTCRTLRRLDRRRPWARAAPRRSTLLSGRLPAGPWQSGETEATALFPSLPPSHPGGLRGQGRLCLFLYSPSPTSAAQLARGCRSPARTPPARPHLSSLTLTQIEEGAAGGGSR